MIFCLASCGHVAEAAEQTEPTPVPEPKVQIVEPAPFLAGETVEEEPAETAEPVETEEPTPEEPETRDRFINPLTGEAAESDTLGFRPYIVMINNIVVAQPHVGVSQADMIWELMDEGGITRMMAFFNDIRDVEKVGSIRSARWYNVSVAQAFDAYLVHAGGSQEALDYIDYDGISDIDYVRGRYTGDTFYRDPTRQAHGIEHSLFATGEGIVQSAADLGYEPLHPGWYYVYGDEFYSLHFSDTAEDQCTEPANLIRLIYAGGKTTSFTYDEEKGLYTAEQYGSTYTDNGEEPVYFRNVLVLNADTVLQEDGLHLTITMEGSGDGYFACGGKYIPIRWEREDVLNNFQFFTEDGEPLSLGVGKSFVAVQQVGDYKGTTEFFG